MSSENVITPTDAELLMQFCRHQDESAFRVLVERHGPLVLGTCRQILRHDHDVDDAFQATFLVLALKARTINRTASVASWLYRVAFRTAMRAAKQRQRRPSESIREDAIVSDDPLVKIHEQSINKALHEELTALPDSYRAPLVLCYLQQHSRQEAASQLECTESSVKARLARGKRMLRLKLARRGIGLSIAIGLVSQDVSEAAIPLTSDMVARTVSSCSIAATNGSPPVSDCSHEVITLAKQGMQSMVVPSIVKSTAAVLAIGVTVAAFNIKADDGADGNVEGNNNSASITLPIAPDGSTTPEQTATPVAPALPSANPVVATIAQAAASPPAPSSPEGLNPNSWIQTIEKSLRRTAQPTASPTNAWWQPIPPTPANDERLGLEISRLRNQRRYLLEKAKGYEVLARAYDMKSEAGKKSSEVSMFEVVEAAGNSLLNRAESDRFKGEAVIIDETIQLLEKQKESAQSHRTQTPEMPSVNLSLRAPASSPVPPTKAASTRLQVGQHIKIHVAGTMPDEPINGIFAIEPHTSAVALGPTYGRVKIAGMELLEAEEAIQRHLAEILKNPRVQVTLPIESGRSRYVPIPPASASQP